MLETRVEVRCHFQGFECSKETAVDNSVHTKESSKDLAAQGGKLRSLKDAERFFFIVIVGKFGLVVHLVSDPTQDFIDVDGSRHRDGFAVTIAPSVFNTRGKALAWSKRVQVGIRGHDGPNCTDIVVEINSVDGNPRGARFTRGQRDLEKYKEGRKESKQGEMG
jgi:hypothetical protein